MMMNIYIFFCIKLQLLDKLLLVKIYFHEVSYGARVMKIVLFEMTQNLRLNFFEQVFKKFIQIVKIRKHF